METSVSRRKELQDAIDTLMRSTRELERVLDDSEKLIKELQTLNEHLNKSI